MELSLGHTTDKWWGQKSYPDHSGSKTWAVLVHFAAQENSSSGGNTHQQLCYSALTAFCLPCHLSTLGRN